MSKHTKGPWAHTDWRVTGPTAAAGFIAARKINESSPEVFVKEIGQHPSIGQDQIGIALGMTKEEAETNARLIAAAPELLEALRELDECYCEAGNDLSKEDRHRHRMTLIKARAAIAKATDAAPSTPSQKVDDATGS